MRCERGLEDGVNLRADLGLNLGSELVVLVRVHGDELDIDREVASCGERVDAAVGKADPVHLRSFPPDGSADENHEEEVTQGREE